MKYKEALLDEEVIEIVRDTAWETVEKYVQAQGKPKEELRQIRLF